MNSALTQHRKSASAPEVGVRRLVLDRLTRYGLLSAAKGGVVALGMKFVSDINDEAEERRRKKFVSTPEIEARVADEDPTAGGKKVANILTDWLLNVPRGPAALDLPVTIGAIALPGIITYSVTSNLIDKMEKRRVEREIGVAKSRHIDRITSTHSTKSDEHPDALGEISSEVSKSVSDLPNIVAGDVPKPKGKKAASLEDAADRMSRAFDVGVGTMVLATVAAGILTHRSRLQKERDLDELYVTENRKKFRRDNPDLFAPRVTIDSAPLALPAPQGTKTASVLQNTLIALNLQEFAHRSDQFRRDAVVEDAQADSDELTDELDHDLDEINAAIGEDPTEE